MNEQKKQITKDERIDFTYPEGFERAAEALDMLPENMREAMLMAFVKAALMH